METYKTVLNHLKSKNKNMFRHINKAGTYFQDAMFIDMADFMAQEMVTYFRTEQCSVNMKANSKALICWLQSMQNEYDKFNLYL